MGGCCGGLGVGGGAWGLIGLLINLVLFAIFAGAAIWLVVWLVRRGSWGHVRAGFPANSPADVPLTPKEILQQRYARGEITREEYLSMLKDLT